MEKLQCDFSQDSPERGLKSERFLGGGLLQCYMTLHVTAHTFAVSANLQILPFHWMTLIRIYYFAYEFIQIMGCVQFLELL